MRFLVVAPRFPYPLDKGDRLTVFNLLRHFSRRHQVALVSFLEPGQQLEHRQHFEEWIEAIYTVPLSRAEAYWNCLSGALSRRPLQTCYYSSPRMAALVRRAVAEFKPDLVYAHTIRAGEYLIGQPVRPRVLAMQIAMTLNYERLARFSRDPLRKLLYALEHRKVRTYEPWIAAQYDRCLLISHADVAAISGAGTLGNVFISPHGVDFEYFKPAGNADRKPGRILFTGNMSYMPNVDAICYFVRDILPLIRAQMPQVGLSIVGTDPAPAVKRLARDPAIEVTGRVPDLRDYFNQARIGIDPLRIGAGLQNKVLEGMAMELPMVITSTANEGIGAAHDDQVLVADEPGAFAAAVLRLLNEPDLATAMGRRARQFIVENWSWEKHFDDLEEELVQLVAATGRTTAPTAPRAKAAV